MCSIKQIVQIYLKTKVLYNNYDEPYSEANYSSFFGIEFNADCDIAYFLYNGKMDTKKDPGQGFICKDFSNLITAIGIIEGLHIEEKSEVNIHIAHGPTYRCLQDGYCKQLFSDKVWDTIRKFKETYDVHLYSISLDDTTIKLQTLADVQRMEKRYNLKSTTEGLTTLYVTRENRKKVSQPRKMVNWRKAELRKDYENAKYIQGVYDSYVEVLNEYVRSRPKHDAQLIIDKETNSYWCNCIGNKEELKADDLKSNLIKVHEEMLNFMPERKIIECRKCMKRYNIEPHKYTCRKCYKEYTSYAIQPLSTCTHCGFCDFDS